MQRILYKNVNADMKINNKFISLSCVQRCFFSGGGKEGKIIGFFSKPSDKIK